MVGKGICKNPPSSFSHPNTTRKATTGGASSSISRNPLPERKGQRHGQHRLKHMVIRVLRVPVPGLIRKPGLYLFFFPTGYIPMLQIISWPGKTSGPTSWKRRTGFLRNTNRQTKVSGSCWVGRRLLTYHYPYIPIVFVISDKQIQAWAAFGTRHQMRNL